MKKKYPYLPLLFLAGALMSCIEPYEIQIPFEEPKLIVDALVSSEPEESLITIGWTYPANTECFFENTYEGYPVPCEPDESQEPYKVTGRVLLIENETGWGVEYPIKMADRKNFVTFVPDFIGVPGFSYSLDIEINYEGEKYSYHSETTMLPTPLIERMSYEIRKGDVGKGDNFVPLISFTEPQDEENYYLFRLCEVSGDYAYCSNGRSWSYSIINDSFLPANVKGLSIDDGATAAKYAEFYPIVSPGIGAQVRMYSIDRKTYEFYKVLLDQFNNDGGAYSPTPASPEGNISGDAIGIFRALHESSGTIYM